MLKTLFPKYLAGRKSLKMASNLAEGMPESDVAELMPCLFPRLGSDNQAQKRLMFIKVNVEKESRLQELAEDGGDALGCILRVAWAILLNCYSGCEDVCFGYHEVSAWGENDNMLSMRHVRLGLGEDTTIEQLVQCAKGGQVEKHGDHHGTLPFGAVKAELFNTELEIRRQPHRVTSDIAPLPPNTMLRDNCRLRGLAKVTDTSVNVFLEWWSSDMTAAQAAGVASTFDKALDYTLTRSEKRSSSPIVRSERVKV